MKKNKPAPQQKAAVTPLYLFCLLMPFAYGGFHEYVSCIYSVFLLGYLGHCYYRNHGLRLQGSLVTGAVALFAAMYLLAGFWAVDPSLAPIGFMKFLPTVLFALTVMQFDGEVRQRLLATVPLSGGAMILFSYPMRFISALEPYFFTAERLGGFFQYPNSFALFLLLGIIILVLQPQKQKWVYAFLPLLMLGIFASGSRTVFFLLALAVPLLSATQKRLRKPLLLVFAAVLAGSLLFVLLSGNLQTVGRFLTSSLNSSTLLGRLLYYRDALPQIAKHPFGMGYLGYYYSQQLFQTGVYSVRYIHNDLLQILLDIGWIPAILVVVAFIKSLFSKKTDLTQKFLLCVIAAHCLVDFDLQFISIFFIALLCLDYSGRFDWKIRYDRKISLTVSAVAGAFCCLYFSVFLALGFWNRHAQALRLYTNYTPSQIMRLTELSDPDEALNLADSILSHNANIAVAYDARAIVAAASGDFAAMADNKQQALAIARYSLPEYLDYYNLLLDAMQYAGVQGDEAAEQLYRSYLQEIPTMLEDIKNETSALGWKIKDQPELDLPQEVADGIARMQQE